MRRCVPTRNPIVQKLVDALVLTPNFCLPPRVEIELEYSERMPPAPVIFALNHTDRYGNFPLQHVLWRRYGRLTATWTKGKNFRTRFGAALNRMMNGIPTPSLGDLITSDFVSTVKRRPSNEEYRALRDLIDCTLVGAADPGSARQRALSAVPEQVFSGLRDVFGLPFDGGATSYESYIERVWREMMAAFVASNGSALKLGLDLLIFPQGSRSRRLSRGRIGLAQIALHFNVPIVPVGVNGSDRLYPSGSPWARGGKVTYRVGRPLLPSDLLTYTPVKPFVPFSGKALREEHERFQALTDELMDRINEVLDPEYTYSNDQESDGVLGVERFM